MPPILKRALKNRWFTASAHAGLWVLLYLAVVNLGGKAPRLRDEEGLAGSPHSPVPVAGIERLFSPGIWPQSLTDTNRLDPFFTRYFIPQAPPPPTTRKIEVTYQGYYQTGTGPKHTIFKLGDAFLVAPIGARIATNLFIAEATMQAMTLTNLAAQTNILPLNVKKEIVVPIGTAEPAAAQAVPPQAGAAAPAAVPATNPISSAAGQPPAALHGKSPGQSGGGGGNRHAQGQNNR